jgi:hypothetical protein
MPNDKGFIREVYVYRGGDCGIVMGYESEFIVSRIWGSGGV